MAVWGGRQTEVRVTTTQRETISLLDNINSIVFLGYLLWIIWNSLSGKTGRISEKYLKKKLLQ